MVLRWALLKAMGPDRWHYYGLLNAVRFSAFRDALERAIRRRQSAGSACSVADLGAGHGLLASAAESLGANPVTRYERLVPLVKIQMGMARANGLSFRVHSQLPGEDSDDDEDDHTESNAEAKAEAKAARAVDVAVVEVWEPTLLGGQQVGLLGNGLVDALNRARGSGVVGAMTQVIPSAVALIACCVHIPPQTELLRCRLDNVSGFDLSHFATFCADAAEPAILRHLSLSYLTPPSPIFILDLNPPHGQHISLPQHGALTLPVTSSSVCNAVVFWHEMTLDEEAVLKAEPGSNTRQAVYFLQDEVRIAAGSSINLVWARCEETKLKFKVEGGCLETSHVAPGTQVVQRWQTTNLKLLLTNLKLLLTNLRESRASWHPGGAAMAFRHAQRPRAKRGVLQRHKNAGSPWRFRLGHRGRHGSARHDGSPRGRWQGSMLREGGEARGSS